MKLYLNNGTMIECTVDEFEELYARGYLGENGMQKALDDFMKAVPGNPIPQTPIKVPRNTEIMLYGCGMPSPLVYQSPDNTYGMPSIDATSGTQDTTPDKK